MKITPVEVKKVIKAKTKAEQKLPLQAYDWWSAKSKEVLKDQLISTISFLKEGQAFRQRQTSIYARLYGNMTLFNFIGNNSTRMDQLQGLPADRPTFNVIQSSIDTLVSRISQARPTPVFLTDNSDYKERNLAKKLNNFILGEFYQTKAYEKATIALRDALVTGDGILHVYKTDENKVGVERVLETELFVDLNEGIYGEPRTMYRIKLIDREVLASIFPGNTTKISVAEGAYPDSSADSSKTTSDLVMVVEAWRLPSKEGAGDGRHSIVCSTGVLFDEEWKKMKFPFVFLKYSPRLLGFWSQGVAEQLMGTQMEINSLLYTISKAIKIVGVPRVFVEDGSKVVSSAFNNDIGNIVKYRGTKPIFEVAQCVPQELYAQLQRLIEYGYQQCGVSSMQATSQKPAGLNSGEAIRSYDDISTDRFAALSRRYNDFFIELAYLIIETAKEICEEEGSYETVYPNKNGVKEIDLPKASLLKNPFIIQCFTSSSLPREPAGRLQKITEMIQAGMLSIKEGRRLLDFPDLDQIETLVNASEERIYSILDAIIEFDKDDEDFKDKELMDIYHPPDPFMDLDLAKDIVVQYINLYVPNKLEPEKFELLRTFYVQVQALKQAALPEQAQGAPANAPQAQPMPLPQSPLVPNAVQ